MAKKKSNKDLGDFFYRLSHRILDVGKDMFFNPLVGKSPLDPILDGLEETLDDGFDITRSKSSRESDKEKEQKKKLQQLAKEQELNLEFLEADKKHKEGVRKKRLKQMEQLRDLQHALDLSKKKTL